MRLLVCAFIVCALTAHAEDSAQDIANKSKERGALNMVGLAAELKLVTTLADGKSKEQLLSTTSKKINGKNHALARFSAPVGVAGVAVLTVEGSAADGDDVSLYLPKLKRVRKVAKGDRGKAFMDTDFAYADITGNGTADSTLKKLEDAKVEGRDCVVLRGTGDESSPYGEVTMFIDKQTWVPMKVEYQDKNGKPLKRYTTIKLKAFKDRTIAAESQMESLQTGSKTKMTVLKLEESTLGDDAFTERALERG